MRNTHDILIISIGKEGEDGGFHKLKSWQQASEPYSGSDEEAVAASNRTQGALDCEVYDDRQFYSLLLKSFITAKNAGAGLKPDDLAQLRKYRRKQQEVDRRASKGRKTRYTVHKKLQNFMFPHDPPMSHLDVDRLLQSLFQ